MGTSSTSVADAAAKNIRDDCVDGTEMEDDLVVLIKAEVCVVADRAATRRKGNLRTTMRSLNIIMVTDVLGGRCGCECAGGAPKYRGNNDNPSADVQ